MIEKRKPSHSLKAFQAIFNDVGRLTLTKSALQGAMSLGFDRHEIIAVIQTIRREHFYKSMTAYADHRLWQDVYHVPSEVGTIYVKFTADIVTEFLLLSFKEK